jgi:prepilin-type processing-associated H-X9-DG protein
MDSRETSYMYWSQQSAGGVTTVDPTFRADFLGIGRLWEIQVVKAQKSFNCPTAIVNGALPPNYWLDRPQWPPFDARDQAGINASKVLVPNGWPETKATYSRRPSPPTNDSTWGAESATDSDRHAWRIWMPGAPAVDNVPRVTALGNNPRYPKRVELHTMAIMSDLAGGDVFLDATHKEGLNVAYADGSAHWVKRQALKDPVSGVSHLAPYPFYYSGWSISSDGKAYQVPLWDDFDRN